MDVLDDESEQVAVPHVDQCPNVSSIKVLRKNSIVSRLLRTISNTTFSGSVRAKAARRTLMKLIHVVSNPHTI